MLYLYEIIFICNFDSKLIKPIHPPSKAWWFCWLNNNKKAAAPAINTSFIAPLLSS